MVGFNGLSLGGVASMTDVVSFGGNSNVDNVGGWRKIGGVEKPKAFVMF